MTPIGLTIADSTPTFTPLPRPKAGAPNVVVLVLYIVNLVVRGSGGYEDVSTVAIILSVVGLGLLGASGWLGGKLAYHYGVRVADEATQAEGFVERTRPGR